VRGKSLIALSLLVSLAGCARLMGGGGHPPKQTRPITVVLVNNAGTCEAKFGKKPQHAFPDDIVSWEFINTCSAQKSVTVNVKNGGNNPFTTAPPWSVNVPPNNSANPASIDLTVSSQASLGVYGFDIFVDGNKYDPKLEIDPYQ
jgi:hypothetical protein